MLKKQTVVKIDLKERKRTKYLRDSSIVGSSLWCINSGGSTPENFQNIIGKKILLANVVPRDEHLLIKIRRTYVK